MIAKGHDYPAITLVGIISADLSLNMPDFRAAERTFQLLTQVAGRAGRGESPGEVFLQTYRPDHYCILFAKDHDYLGFCQKELEFRRELRYPPFSRMARLRVESGEAELAKAFAGRLADELGRLLPAEVAEVMGPSPGVFPKLQNRYRWQVLLKAPTAKLLLQALRRGTELIERNLRPPSGVRFGVDVDPVELF
jgi:primosomal protein N' (replication factor Y)